MKEIQLTQGKVAFVDDDDFDFLSKFKWHARRAKNNWYADTSLPSGEKSMHRILMNDPEGFLVDHKDMNGLNNQRSNLRLASQSQNLTNVGKPKTKNPHSIYKGVTFSRHKNKWMAQIKQDYKYKYIGYFSTETEAALAYNYTSFFLHGEFANLNQLPIT